MQGLTEVEWHGNVPVDHSVEGELIELICDSDPFSKFRPGLQGQTKCPFALSPLGLTCSVQVDLTLGQSE